MTMYSIVNKLSIVVRKFFTPMEAQIQLFKSYIVTQFMDILFCVIHTRTLLENLL